MRTEKWNWSIGNQPLFIDNEESAYFERQAYSIKQYLEEGSDKYKAMMRVVDKYCKD
jgi:hypothetical protein